MNTATDPTKLDPVDVVALGHVLSHAAVVGLTMPRLAVIVDAQLERRIRLDFDSLADLADWALYAEACIASSSPEGSIVENHVCDAEVLELKVRMTAMTVVATAPEPVRPALALVEPLIDPDEEPVADWEQAILDGVAAESPFGNDFGCCVPGRQDAPGPLAGPAIGSTDHYSCPHCKAAFGIAGESDGSVEDELADEYFQSEVERHQSGACVTGASA